jgi:S-adenosyl methyltransferase
VPPLPRPSTRGQDDFAADREVGEAMIAAYPTMVELMRANRAFLRRAVRFLAGEAGIRQFVDVGTGIPTAGNTHEVAHAIPDSDDPHAIVARFMNAVPAGSYLSISHPASDIEPGKAADVADRLKRLSYQQYTPAPAPRCSGSSTVWSWWSPGWFRSSDGGQPSRRTRRSRSGPGWRASKLSDYPDQLFYAKRYYGQ